MATAYYFRRSRHDTPASIKERIDTVVKWLRPRSIPAVVPYIDNAGEAPVHLARLTGDATRGQISQVIFSSIADVGDAIPEIIKILNGLDAAKVEYIILDVDVSKSPQSAAAIKMMVSQLHRVHRKWLHAKREAAKKLSGRIGGRPRSAVPIEAVIAVRRGRPAEDVAAEFKISKTTLLRRLKEQEI